MSSILQMWIYEEHQKEAIYFSANMQESVVKIMSSPRPCNCNCLYYTTSISKQNSNATLTYYIEQNSIYYVSDNVSDRHQSCLTTRVLLPASTFCSCIQWQKLKTEKNKKSILPNRKDRADYIALGYYASDYLL